MLRFVYSGAIKPKSGLRFLHVQAQRGLTAPLRHISCLKSTQRLPASCLQTVVTTKPASATHSSPGPWLRGAGASGLFRHRGLLLRVRSYLSPRPGCQAAPELPRSAETRVQQTVFLWENNGFESLVIRIRAKLELSHWEPGRAFQHLGKSST